MTFNPETRVIPGNDGKYYFQWLNPVGIWKTSHGSYNSQDEAEEWRSKFIKSLSRYQQFKKLDSPLLDDLWSKKSGLATEIVEPFDPYKNAFQFSALIHVAIGIVLGIAISNLLKVFYELGVGCR